MDGDNLTPFPAVFPRTVLDDERMAASMIARVTFDIIHGAARIADEQPWLVCPEPWDSPLGTFDADQPFRKDGVDLFVLGQARAPAGDPVRELALSVEIGAFRLDAKVFGPRVWQKDAQGQLVPSEPEPFVVQPIGPEAAYGGTAILQGHEAQYPLNPQGTGFYIDEASAEGRPLAWLEDPGAPIRRFDDRPEPLGFGICNLTHPLRLRESIEVEDGRMTNIRLRMFNRAHPRMITPRVDPGDAVRLAGFSAEGPIAFAIPATPVRVLLRLGDRLIERVPAIDEVGIDVGRAQVFIGYRYPFRYVVHPFEERTCTLAPAVP